jgi:hypothetical protein
MCKATELFFYIILIIASTVILEQWVDYDHRISYAEQSFGEDNTDSDTPNDVLFTSAPNTYLNSENIALLYFISISTNPNFRNNFIRAPPLSS